MQAYRVHIASICHSRGVPLGFHLEVKTNQDIKINFRRKISTNYWQISSYNWFILSHFLHLSIGQVFRWFHLHFFHVPVVHIFQCVWLFCENVVLVLVIFYFVWFSCLEGASIFGTLKNTLLMMLRSMFGEASSAGILFSTIRTYYFGLRIRETEQRNAAGHNKYANKKCVLPILLSNSLVRTHLHDMLQSVTLHLLWGIWLLKLLGNVHTKQHHWHVSIGNVWAHHFVLETLFLGSEVLGSVNSMEIAKFSVHCDQSY